VVIQRRQHYETVRALWLADQSGLSQNHPLIDKAGTGFAKARSGWKIHPSIPGHSSLADAS
jgi:hypothetical protein